MNNVFLYKANSEVRDCVAYINLDDLRKKHVCIDGKFKIHGACYSISLKEERVNYEDIDTVLTEQEFKMLCNPAGHNFTEIIDRLLSQENAVLFEKVKEEEKEWLMDEYGLSEDDVNLIFEEYRPQYRDRGVVGYVYEDTYDLGYEEAWAFGWVDRNNIFVMDKHFDFKGFGEDLLDQEKYCKLEDGRIVYMNY